MQKKYNSLNGMRAYAAIAILAMHVLENSHYIKIDNVVYIRIGALKWLVYLFMIISGFSLCCGYYDKILQQKISIVEFYKKRYRKILPFFTLMVLMDCIANFNINSIIEAIADISLAFALLPNASISVVGVGWFLGIVFLFYMLFPFFCFLIRNKKSAWITLGICIFYNLSEQFYFLNFNHVIEGYQKHTNFLFCSMFFCIGGLIYLYRYEITEIIKNIKNIYLIFILIITIIVLINWSEITNWAQPFICLSLYCMWILYAISVESIILNNKVLNFIAEISLEIYLCHMFVYRIIEKLNGIYILGYGYTSYILTVFLTFIGSIIVSLLAKKIFKFSRETLKQVQKKYLKIYYEERIRRKNNG